MRRCRTTASLSLLFDLARPSESELELPGSSEIGGAEVKRDPFCVADRVTGAK